MKNLKDIVNINKQLYGMFAEGYISEGIFNREPDLITKLEPDLFLEQYLVDSARGSNTYALTFVKVILPNGFVFRTKYDSGMLENGKQDLKNYHASCLVYIGTLHDLKWFREQGVREYKKIGFVKRYLAKVL